MQNVVSVPNDKVAIIVEKNDNRNNTYTLLPVEVSIGKVDELGYFISEDESYKVPSIENAKFLSDQNITKAYAFLINTQKLEEKYPNTEELSLQLYNYLKEISSKLNIALLDDDKVHVYSTEYSNISKNIVGGVTKKYENQEECLDLVEVPQVITKEYNDKIDEEGLENYLKERIFDNDDILEDIATTIALNYTAMHKSEVEPILSIGQTGSGKTATFEAIAEYLDVPLTIYDCNELTSAGYVGKDIDDIMREIYFNSNENIEKAERSILVLDEFDKLASRGSHVKDSSVQYALLKLLDGYQYTFEKRKNGPQVSLDSSFITIGALGAFPDMYESKKKKSALGFNKNLEDEEIISFTTDDLTKFGMLTELIGRFNNIYTYTSLDKDGLKKALLQSKNSPLLRKLERYEREFGVKTTYEDSFIDALVELAYAQKIGGRSLNKIVAKTFKKIDRELVRKKDNNKQKKLVLTKEVVENNRSYNI